VQIISLPFQKKTKKSFSPKQVGVPMQCIKSQE
jgi:hypothetical protein